MPQEQTQPASKADVIEVGAIEVGAIEASTLTADTIDATVTVEAGANETSASETSATETSAIEPITDSTALQPGPPLPLNSAPLKPGASQIKVFWDEAMITATELVYGQTTYPLDTIASLQILKLSHRRSVVQKKVSTLLAGLLIGLAGVLLIGFSHSLIRLFSLTLMALSTGYIVYFNWWLDQRRRGEYGLSLSLEPHGAVVITSNSLPAIQALYRAIFERTEGYDRSQELLVINMYTGEFKRLCDRD